MSTWVQRPQVQKQYKFMRENNKVYFVPIFNCYYFTHWHENNEINFVIYLPHLEHKN